jgi:2-amino-4-hydroxy-6-hydroxymethyldihydropteridine diphosphokinase
MSKRVFLSLGSNVGDRAANLREALARLSGAGVGVRRVSSFFRTEPVGFQAQTWFINCVLEGETEKMPLRLLNTLQRIEWQMGRRGGRRFGPRAIDLDILLYENAVVRLAKLTIPHPRLAERRFMLIPLRELAPHLRHPATQRTVTEMLSETHDTSQVIRLKEDSNPSEGT